MKSPERQVTALIEQIEEIASAGSPDDATALVVDFLRHHEGQISNPQAARLHYLLGVLYSVNRAPSLAQAAYRRAERFNNDRFLADVLEREQRAVSRTRSQAASLQAALAGEYLRLSSARNRLMAGAVASLLGWLAPQHEQSTWYGRAASLLPPDSIYRTALEIRWQRNASSRRWRT